MDRGGLTRAGRALDKHGGRPDSVFPKATGNPASKNMQGQYQLDDILTNPTGTIKRCNRPRYGGEVIDIKIPEDRGVRFSADGEFIGFLNP
jgi:filamentous hemagglutinin